MAKTLLIDNYDSFTSNLYHLLAAVDGEAPEVVRNDEVGWPQLASAGFDSIVISPGPGRPERPADMGVSTDAIRHSSIPLLGVCLGHQGIAHACGGVVTNAPEPVHGRLAKIHHGGAGLFAGLPSPFAAVRYHSLVVSELPAELECTARCDDGLVMALRHRTRPLWGVQFHPESIASEHGRALLRNFRRLTGTDRSDDSRRTRAATGRGIRERSRGADFAGPPVRYTMTVRRLDFPVDAERAHSELFAGSRRSFWLDSAAVIPGLSRFSYLGDDTGPHAEYVTADVEHGVVSVTTAAGRVTHEGGFLDYLDVELARRTVQGPPTDWGFDLGYVGFLGYELKAESGGRPAHRSSTPDAAMLFADRMLVVDHALGSAFLVALSRAGTREQTLRWLGETADRLRAAGRRPVAPEPPVADPVNVTYRHDEHAYTELIDRCLQEITDGESYELCLTNMATVDATVDPNRLHAALRRGNPAPYAALLRLDDLAVVSSSPERFLRIDGDRVVEARPIKGTRRRAASPAEDRAVRDELRNSEKDLAENLMIVDLLRNDLGRVCEVGSVEAPRLFDVETYATVHQLVSTIRGRLRPDRTVVDAVRAAFPGGSMTGAPKRRSMDILDRLEAGPRGAYSGALGFFALGGEVDLSIVIRAAVVTADRVTIGMGGAIVALSDPEEELAETLVKAEPVLAAIARAAGPSAGEPADP